MVDFNFVYTAGISLQGLISLANSDYVGIKEIVYYCTHSLSDIMKSLHKVK